MNSLLEWSEDDSLSNEEIVSRINGQTAELLGSIPKYLAMQRQSEGSKPFLNFISRLAHIEDISEDVSSDGSSSVPAQ